MKFKLLTIFAMINVYDVIQVVQEKVAVKCFFPYFMMTTCAYISWNMQQICKNNKAKVTQWYTWVVFALLLAANKYQSSLSFEWALIFVSCKHVLVFTMLLIMFASKQNFHKTVKWRLYVFILLMDLFGEYKVIFVFTFSLFQAPYTADWLITETGWGGKISKPSDFLIII